MFRSRHETGGRCQLPVTGGLATCYALSLVVALLMAGASLCGLLLPRIVYQTTEARAAFFTNDLINLVVGLPILTSAMWWARRGSLVGLLLWPGALLYAVYNYTAYVFGLPLSLATSAYLAVVVAGAWAIFTLLRQTDGEAVSRRLSGAVPARTAGWVMVVLGLLFTLRAAATLVGAGGGGATLAAPEAGVLIADVVVSAAMICSGALLIWRRHLGYVSGLGALFGASMLFVSLIVYLLLQPVLTEAPFAPADVAVVAIMGMVCFVPFGLYLRGVMSARMPD